jgi:glucan 1,3-beta-glucosidase
MWALVEDTHHYEVFDQGSVSMSTAQHISTACGFSSQMTSSNKWTISGEWSGAMTDCAKYLNGYGKGARYDGSLAGSTYVGSCDGFTSGSVSQLPAATQQGIRQFVEAQLDAFEQAAGWIWWCWKTEQGAPGWDMQDMLANGLFPQPITARQCMRSNIRNLTVKIKLTSSRSKPVRLFVIEHRTVRSMLESNMMK